MGGDCGIATTTPNCSESISDGCGGRNPLPHYRAGPVGERHLVDRNSRRQAAGDSARAQRYAAWRGSRLGRIAQDRQRRRCVRIASR